MIFVPLGTKCVVFFIFFFHIACLTARCWMEKRIFYQHFVPNGTLINFPAFTLMEDDLILRFVYSEFCIFQTTQVAQNQHSMPAK